MIKLYYAQNTHSAFHQNRIYFFTSLVLSFLAQESAKLFDSLNTSSFDDMWVELVTALHES
jgi:hypothetical protein